MTIVAKPARPGARSDALGALRVVVVLLAAAAATFVPRRADADDKDACATAAESAQSLLRRGKLIDARTQALACARTVCPAVVKQDCDALFASLELTIPSLVVAPRDPSGADVLGAVVRLDGVVVDASNGQAIRVDPGVHTLLVTANGRLPAEQKLAVHEGERARPVLVTLASKDAPPHPPPFVPVPPPIPAYEVSPLVWILGTLSAVSLIGFGVFEIEAVSDRTHFKHTCAPRCSSDQADTVRNEELLGWISGGAAVAFAGGAVLAWKLSGPRQPTVQVGLSPSSVSLAGRF